MARVPLRPEDDFQSDPLVPAAAEDFDDDDESSRSLRGMIQPRVLVTFAVLVALAILLPRLRHFMPDVSERPEYTLETRTIAYTTPPAWVPKDLLDRIARDSDWPETFSVTDEDLVEKIAEGFGNHPWIAEVVRVEKSVPAEVRVELEYRKPVAMVELASGLYAVDGDGIVLPSEDFSKTDAAKLPRIKGISTLPRRVGRYWGDGRVLAAARIAEVLAPQWSSFQLRGIVAPDPDSRGKQPAIGDLMFSLEANNGSRIHWGRPPGSGHPGELSAKQKIGRIETYLARHGSLTDPKQRYEIDIRHWQEITRRPLPAYR